MAESWRNLPKFNGVYSMDPNKREVASETSDGEEPRGDDVNDDGDEGTSVTSTAAAS